LQRRPREQPGRIEDGERRVRRRYEKRNLATAEDDGIATSPFEPADDARDLDAPVAFDSCLHALIENDGVDPRTLAGIGNAMIDPQAYSASAREVAKSNVGRV